MATNSHSQKKPSADTSPDTSTATSVKIKTMHELAQCVDYSLLNTLTADPQATEDGNDHKPRQIFSGHYVPVTPTPIADPLYVAHSHAFFDELGFDENLALEHDFKRLFSGDMSNIDSNIHPYGWATGYALSIYGTEYTQQCPFQTGNGYGDGRALSVLEVELNGKRWEMQLKGAGRTPYCRGADGRAVLRSSVREFLAQEHMHALGIPTSRSLSLFMSQSETVDRPWYLEGSDSQDPEVMVPNLVAISTRVAPSFLRVGQVELFGRRARRHEHPNALNELKAIVAHLIEREYKEDIDTTLPFEKQVVELAIAFRERLTTLVSHWVRVGYCQGNFNSDNCAGGGYTLDYGPFGFCEMFDPVYQPWTGGGRHFSFLNQPIAAHKNFEMLCSALAVLLEDAEDEANALSLVSDEFPEVMESKMQEMWAAKLGLSRYDHTLLVELLQLMVRTGVDYTIFFRELSSLPKDVSALSPSFYNAPKELLLSHWKAWLGAWQKQIENSGDKESIAAQMLRTNPKYTWREWLVVPAYKLAETGDFTRIHYLQDILGKPYEEQTQAIEQEFYKRRPLEFFGAGGVSHYSCSS
jgi:uncharacterized protein YdiU (UPF0061 family)